MGRTDPILLGYFPKRRVAPPDWMLTRGVDEIASVSLCLAPGPDAWQDSWRHNSWGLFPDPGTAWSVVPEGSRDGYRLYAYALYPEEYADGGVGSMRVEAPDVEELEPEYELVGYDVVSRSAGSRFECSPLSCNLLAQEVDSNRYCLMPDLASARRLAASAESKGCEPGPYHVLQVWRRRGKGTGEGLDVR